MHLLPHIQAACAEAGSPWRLIAISITDARFILDLEWLRPGGMLDSDGSFRGHGHLVELRATGPPWRRSCIGNRACINRGRCVY